MIVGVLVARRNREHTRETLRFPLLRSFYSAGAIRGTPCQQIQSCYGHRQLPSCARLGQPRAAVPTLTSAVHKLCEHAVRIDRYEQTLTTRQHFPFLVQDLSHIDVLPALHLHFARFHPQGPVQGHGLQVVHGHLGGHRHHVTQFIHLAHGLVEDGCDNAAVAVSGRPGVALAQAESTDKAVALLIVGKAQVHAVRIVLAAGETVVLLQLYVACVVSSLVLFASHRKILSRVRRRIGYHGTPKEVPHASRPYNARTLRRSSWRSPNSEVDTGVAKEDR